MSSGNILLDLLLLLQTCDLYCKESQGQTILVGDYWRKPVLSKSSGSVDACIPCYTMWFTPLCIIRLSSNMGACSRNYWGFIARRQQSSNFSFAGEASIQHLSLFGFFFCWRWRGEGATESLFLWVHHQAKLFFSVLDKGRKGKNMLSAEIVLDPWSYPIDIAILA